MLATYKQARQQANASPRTRNVYKLSGTLAVFITLGFLSIWAFSPITPAPLTLAPDALNANNPKNLDYMPVQALGSTNLSSNNQRNVGDIAASFVPSYAQGEISLDQIEQNLQRASSDLAIIESKIALAYAANTLINQEKTRPNDFNISGQLSALAISTNKASNKAITNAMALEPTGRIHSSKTEVVLASAAPALELKQLTHAAPALKKTQAMQPPIVEINTSTPLQNIIGEDNALGATKASNPVGSLKTFTVKAGDSLGKIFEKANIRSNKAIKLAKLKKARPLKYLSIGKTLRFYFDADDKWETLEYDLDKLTTLIVTPDDNRFDISEHTKVVEYRNFEAFGEIKTTLGEAFESANLSASLAVNLVDIYKWEIDFARDTRAGDSFSFIYQKAFIDGEFIENGTILAASFHNRGRTIKAIRYTDSDNFTAYFQPNGESLRRGFLRTPVKYARISSGFGKRKHPIKKTWKTHKGVDYAARRGTPILSTADGVVQFAGRKGGYGKTIILRHGGIYTTLYAHMSRLKKGIRKGKTVKQGQVIGYVGRSGWATGDHLHYEFRVNNKHKNPLKVKLPKTLPLAKKERNDFSKKSKPLLATLSSLQASTVAKASELDVRQQGTF